MTLARRIWLGFGVMFAALLILGVAAYLGIKAVEEEARRLEPSAQPAEETLGELRSSILGTEAAAFGYLETGDPRFERRIDEEVRAFERAERQLAGGSFSEEDKRLVARIGDLFGEYETTAEDLRRQRENQRELLLEGGLGLQKGRTVLQDMLANAGQDRLVDAAELEELGESLEGEGELQREDLRRSRRVLKDLRARVDDPADSAKLEELMRMEQGLDGVRTWSGAYLADPRQDYRTSTNASVERLEASLARYKELELTEGEREKATELTALLGESLPAVKRAISLTDTVDEGISDLEALKKDMDEALGELRLSASRDHSAGVNAVDRTAERASRVLLATLIATGVVGVTTALVMGGGVLRSVRRLTEEAREARNEDYDRQIHVATNDELGVLADVLNSVTEQSRQDREELGHLGRLLQDKVARVAELEAVIGDLRLRERETRETERRNRLSARALNYGVFEWDPHTDEVRWDDVCLELLGLPREQAAPTFEAFLQTVHPEDRRGVRDALADHVERGAEFAVEYRVRHADGAYHHVVSRAETERDGEGKASRMVGIIGDVTERKALEEQLAILAFHDPLTSLPNRALFMDRLEHTLARAERQEAKPAVLFLDLDNFKNVNDSLGHEAGDRVLVALAERLRACVRPGDTVARLGGDEFTVLLDRAGEVEARRVAERILQGLGAPVTIDGRQFRLTPSIGVSLGGAGTRPADLLRNADAAMYEAKRAGKARYEVFRAGMGAGTLDRLELENDLRRAVEDEEFVVHYQPKVLLSSMGVFALEALVRWNHPRRGLVPPDEFIPFAEESDLILAIGNWVLRQACGHTRAWQDQHPGEPPLMVSVNLSPRQFRQPDLGESVARVLFETGLAPGCLTLEVTENVLMEDPHAAGATLQLLRNLGVSIAIDDFGMAHSSLARLKHWPIDTLKVDRSFVAGLGEDEDDGVLVSGILNMADGLGLTVVAEGVETSKQLAQLRALGCSRAQGFYFSRPLPRDEVAPLLERHFYR